MAQNVITPQVNLAAKAAAYRIQGIVQGVGFRPFIYTLALRFGLTGWVRNTSSGVEVHLEGTAENLAAWLTALQAELPPLARITSISQEPAEYQGCTTFAILASTAQIGAYQAIPADAATCPQCLSELFDPANRRYRYPFINCTHCGPRFTIINDIPYDRPKTTMRSFKMCPACQREYDDPLDRRFHAQPNACPVCGPHVDLLDARGNVLATEEQALEESAARLRKGEIIALKGVGGFQLACDATNQAAVLRLRERKRRPAKPFALMLPNLDAASEFVALTQTERDLLQLPSAPIVLCQSLTESPIAKAVAPYLDTLGVMLPYTPLHHLLLHDVNIPLVMTSGNLSEEPLACQNAEALERLAGIADVFLVHNREINTRLDDSVLFVSGNNPQLVRRARGFAPNPIQLVDEGPSVLACGAELKNTFCLAREKYAFMSQHLGDMQNLETWHAFEESLALYKHVFHTEPGAVAFDMHPDYMTTRYALGQSNLRQVAIQHHHAHLAACLADNQSNGPAIGVIFDGTGYGLDGTIWGGEFLVGDAGGFVRAGYLQPLPLPGGEAAIHKPYRTAWAYWRTLLADTPLPATLDVPTEESDLLAAMLAQHLNTPLTSSAGRLFDAVSALLGIRGVTSYEAQAAIELEVVARQAAASPESLPFDLTALTQLQHWGSAPVNVETGYMVNLAPLVQTLNENLSRVTIPVLAYRFHAAIARIIASVCHKLSANTGIKLVALSGGCFQNKLLLELTDRALRELRLDVLCHTQVPCNDGGLALGQAVIARTMLRS